MKGAARRETTEANKEYTKRNGPTNAKYKSPPSHFFKVFLDNFNLHYHSLQINVSLS